MANEQTRSPGVQGETSSETAQPAPVARAVEQRAAEVSGSTYSEKQVTEILRRAAQLERGRAQEKPELSREEIENTALEAGLDPSLVRIAAQSIAVREGERGLKARILGAPTRKVIERVIDGEISTADHERLIGDLRGVIRTENRNHHPPQISSVGRTLTLSGGFCEVEMVPRGGKTLLRIEINCGPIAGGFFGGLGSFGGGMSPLVFALLQHGHLGPAGAIIGVAGLWGGTFALARSLFSWRANTEFKRLEKVADRLAERLREEIGARTQK